jgi:DNA-binding LytR/AlgR family response regulator
MKINCIAIDDEPLALDIIREYCAKVPFLNLLRTFDNAIESLEFLRSRSVDLIFLDIQMQDLTGIQLLRAIQHPPMVIFTTAYDHYAIEGFDLDGLDYMLKPVSFERFMKGVDKALDRMKQLPGNGANDDIQPAECKEDFFFVKTETRIERICFSDVLFIEGKGDYWRIVMPGRKIMSLLNYRKLEEILPPGRFVRVHKSYVVSLEKIDSVERNRIFIGTHVIPISDTFHKQFFELIERRK